MTSPKTRSLPALRAVRLRAAQPSTPPASPAVRRPAETRPATASDATRFEPRAALTAPRATTARRVTFTFDAGPTPFTRPQLKGSWDAAGHPSERWSEPVAMRPVGKGLWEASVELQDDGSGRVIEWGVEADMPHGKAQWALMGEGNQQFRLNAEARAVSYAPTTYHRMGARRSGDGDLRFTFWAPNARKAQVKVTSPQGVVQRLPMTRDADGLWSHEARGAWKALEGHAYVYELVTSDGKDVERTDPYALRVQGEQRGLSRIFIDPAGHEANYYSPVRTELMRFEVDDQPRATEAYLVLKDASGRPLDKAALLARVGAFDASLVGTARMGAFNDFWTENVTDDGRIQLVKVDGAFTALMNNPAALAGLRYEFQAYAPGEDGKPVLLGDTDRSGKLDAAEARATNYNDPWSPVITPTSGYSFRGAVIAEPTYVFKNDHAPRERDRNKWVIYQLHAGSFASSGINADRSTLEDVIGKLKHLKELGVNAVELLPVNEVEGIRGWGYDGVNTLAVESGLGFEDADGRWIHGDEALARLVDEAHGLGLNVINDVVYNHVHGLINNLWELDGPENPYFNWSPGSSTYEGRRTPWGELPAYVQRKVVQLFVDHAAMQVNAFHADGLRFDFTEPIKGLGGREGWNFLREVMRLLHALDPHQFALAEQFDYDKFLTEPVQKNGTGGGFDAQWYTEIQHRMTRDSNPSRPGAIQAAAAGKRTDMDDLLRAIVQPIGLFTWTKAVAMISNHDEVGNAERTIDTADGESTARIPPQWARAAARLAAGFGFTGPGIPMFFQGDESLAQNSFKWAITSTWDLGWDWKATGADWDWNQLTFNDDQRALYERLLALPERERAQAPEVQALNRTDRAVLDTLASEDPETRQQTMQNITRRQTFEFYKDAIAFRLGNASSNTAGRAAAQAEQSVRGLYTHNDDSVLATLHEKDGQQLVRVISLNRENLSGYPIPLPEGQWREVFNSDARRYGGNDFGNAGAVVDGGAPRGLNLPAAGYVMFERVA